MSSNWLITGGSSGIGLALGRFVLAKGVKAVLTTRSIAKAQQAAPDVEKSGGIWLQLGFSDANLEQVVSDAVTKHNIDVIVNNAGFALVGAVEQLNIDEVRGQYEANLFGPIRIIQAATPIFRQRKAGTIVNIGSSASLTGFPALAVYGSTKGAFRTFTEGLTGELAEFGIRVLLIELGQFRTNFGGAATFTPMNEAYKDSMVGKVLGNLGKTPSPGNPDEAAARIFEIVTYTGMAAGGAVDGISRFPLGPDAHAGTIKTGKSWIEIAEKAAPIATSTNHLDVA